MTEREIAYSVSMLTARLADNQIQVFTNKKSGMGIKQLMMDVDKALDRPSLIEISAAIEAQKGVEGLSIVVTEVDMETVGMEITVEGEELNYDQIVSAIERTGAVVHSLDQVLAGKKMITPTRRIR